MGDGQIYSEVGRPSPDVFAGAGCGNPAESGGREIVGSVQRKILNDTGVSDIPCRDGEGCLAFRLVCTADVARVENGFCKAAEILVK